MPKGPKLIVVVLGALALAGGTVTAFAVTGGNHGQSGVHPASPTTTVEEVTETVDTEATDATTDDTTAEDASVERFWDPQVCGEDQGRHGNHGDFVQLADRNGEARREAAHSPCGKPLTAVDAAEASATAGGPPADLPHGPPTEHVNQGHGPPADPGAQGLGHGKP
jgi:hypothetical protein